jgi:hypothetical protein
LKAAAAVAAVGAPARLMFTLARRGGTQEEAAALFVAAARGLGCQARTVTALAPVPLRASAAALERVGVIVGPARYHPPRDSPQCRLKTLASSCKWGGYHDVASIIWQAPGVGATRRGRRRRGRVGA